MNSLPRTRGLAALLATGALVVGSLVATAAPAYAADPVAGGQTASPADTLFPNQGNSGYDVSHYDINLKVNVAISETNNAVSNSTVPEATATIDATTTGAPLSSYSFDFQGSTGNLAASTFNVSAVTVNGVPATFSRIENTTTSSALTDNHKLIVTPATPVDGAFTTVVTYGGTPVRHTDTDGSAEGWNNTVDGATFLNQPVGSMTLFPNNNTPRDKATYKFTVNAPSTLTTSNTVASANPGVRAAAVAANGELTSKTVSGDGTRTTWVWEELKPMASELSMVSVGRYDVYESDITLASGRTIHEWSFIDPSISLANQTTTQGSRSRLKSLIDFYETKYGPYPGNSTGVVTDIVPSAINYALETQDRPFFPNSASGTTFYHEMMHQWWGDSVAPGDWNDIWLNEGPATVSEFQIPFESAGTTTTATNETNRYALYNSSSSSFWTTPTAAMTQASTLFGSQVYDRGSMALAALRIAIGDANFELLMKQEQLVNGGTSRRTSEFISRAQTISGKDLTAFFNAWIYTGSKPAWPNKFTYGVTQPAGPLDPEGPFTLTLNNRNTGRVAETGAAVSIDISDILDDATIGTLPANVTQSGNVLTWAIPSTATSASNSAAIPFTINAGTLGHTLSGTLTTGTTMLGGTCFNCSFSDTIGSSELSPAPTPTISGTPAPGQTLTADAGVWPDGTALSYQWTVDNVPIAGATSATFVPDMYSFGLLVRVQVTGTLGNLLPTVRTSLPTAAVARVAMTTGTPTISGTPQLGKPLTVDPGTGWTAGTYFTYAWSANGSAISGATGPIYIPAVGTQVGQTITVTVTGSRAGYTNGVVTSAATAAVVTNTFTATPNPVIVGNGRTLSAQAASTPGWDDFTTFSYAWSSNGTPISGATAQTYTPPTSLLGASLTVTVTSTKSGYPTVVKTSDPVILQLAVQVLQPTPTLSGTPTFGNTLTLTPGSWDSGTTRTYEWFADGASISGATGLTYVLTAAEVGKQITAAVTSTRTSYSTVVKTTAPTAVVAPATQTLTPTPTISGTAQVGETLTAAAGTWDAGVALAYHWSADGEAVLSATTDTFHPGSDQIGKAITVSVTGTKSGYTTVTKTSDATSAVLIGAFDPAPVPVISGTAKVGVELTGAPGSWDADAGLTYQWLADSEPIVGATELTYTPGPDRVGAVLTFAVTGAADGFTTVTRTSDATAAVVKGSFSATPDPTISGTAQVDVLLTATPGDWDDEVALAYQWFADGDEIAGADDSEFIPGVDEVGAEITVEVTGTREGYDTVAKTSAATAAVVAGDLAMTPPPSFTGASPQVGVQFTAIPGTWTSGVTLSYQWLADGNPISGATSVTFTPGVAQLGAAISVKVTGTKSGYTTVSKTSPSSSAIQEGDQTLQPTPTITGTPQFGTQLTATAGTWDAGTSLAYQWLADGDAISGATSLTFTPGVDELGTALTFQVTSTKDGYATVVKTSAATAAVASLTLTTTPTPKVVGTAKVGMILSAATAAWQSGVTLTFAWSADGTTIPGATAATLIPGAAQVGKAITVSVTGSKPGYASVTKTSLATKKVLVGALAATATPKIGGTARVGQTLSALTGEWVAGTGFAFQWKSNGKAITGATDDTLELTPALNGKTITVTVTGSQAGYASVAKTSAGKKVTSGIQTLQPVPGITGTLTVGSTLSLVPAAHDAGTTVSYIWYMDGKKVGTGTSLVLTNTMRNHHISLKSTSSKPGYVTVVKVSLKTPKVGVII